MAGTYWGEAKAPVPADAPQAAREKTWAGSIILVVLIIAVAGVSGYVMYRQTEAQEQMRKQAQLALELERNQRALLDYVLTGNPDDVAALKRGSGDIHALIQDLSASTTDADIKSELHQLAEHEDQWNAKFAMPVIAKREQIDEGKGTLAELQIFFLQQDPGEWSGLVSAPGRWFLKPL